MTEVKEEMEHELIWELVLISLCLCSKEREIWDQAGVTVVWDLKSSLTPPSLSPLINRWWSHADKNLPYLMFLSYPRHLKPFVDLAILHTSRPLVSPGRILLAPPRSHLWPPWRPLASVGFLPAQRWLPKAWKAAQCLALPDLPQSLWTIRSHPVLSKAPGPSNWDSSESGGVCCKMGTRSKIQTIQGEIQPHSRNLCN